jgi:hypothetical protein
MRQYLDQLHPAGRPFHAVSDGSSMRPYLTLVTFVRNDDYTNDYLVRVRRAWSFLLSQIEHHRLEAEIVIVEWNPPGGRPLVSDLLECPPDGGYVTVRVVVVDGKFHAGFLGGDQRAVHVHETANVGIRRARGSFVVLKMSDTFYSHGLMDQISRRTLRTDAVYRCDRIDSSVDTAELERLSDDDLIERFWHGVITRNSRLKQPEHWHIRDLHTNASGDFLLLSRNYWHLVGGFPSDDTVLCLDGDSIVMHAVAALGAHEICFPPDCVVFKPWHDHLSNVRISQEWKFWQRALDILLRRTFNHEAGLHARILFDFPKRKMRGIDHVLGSSIERNFVAQARRWTQGELPALRRDNWGLANQSLPESILCRAGWDDDAMHRGSE